MAKILIIEDDPNFSASITLALQSENHMTELAEDGEEALHRLLCYQYDLVVCDWILPSISGIEICREYRANGGDSLILMLTGKTSPEDIQSGLSAGADDYLTKPFHTGELLARVRALIRRSAKPVEQNTLSFRDVVFDRASLSVTKAGQALKLSKKEMTLLALFLKNPERIFSIQALMNAAWPGDDTASDESVRTHIKTLRQKLKGQDELDVIENIHGQGYKLKT